MTDPPDIGKIVADTLSAMTFREKSLIARMDREALPYLQYAFDRYISANFPDDDRRAGELMRRLWAACRETHKLRSVK